MESIFFVLMSLVILSYGLHRPFIALYVRKLDGLTITVYRNISFIITMLPLLFFVEFFEIAEILNHIPLLFFAAITAFISFTSSLSASKNLPIAIAGGVRQVINVMFSIFLGYIFFSEVILFEEMIVIVFILIATITLSVMKMDISHLKNSSVLKGLLLTLISGLFNALSFFFFAKLSRELNPLVATYFWETSIGVIALIFALVFGGKYKVPKLKLLPRKNAVSIVLVSLLAIVGTLSYSFAINFGDLAIASSFMTTIIVVNTIAAYFLFKEKLNIKQLIMIFLIIVGIVLLKLIS